jgi:hypothetical protein
MNRSPSLVTIGVAIVLILVGVLGTFLAVLPEKVGIWSYVAATAILLIGIIFRRV